MGLFAFKQEAIVEDPKVLQYLKECRASSEEGSSSGDEKSQVK
jgi:hypothetical protein